MWREEKGRNNQIFIRDVVCYLCMENIRYLDEWDEDMVRCYAKCIQQRASIIRKE